MARSKRLEPLARIAEHRQQDAAGRFKQSRERLARYQAKLEEMRRYRAEYLDGFGERGREGLRGDEIKRFQAFVAKLDETIGQLEGLVAGERSQVERDRALWLAKRARTKALDGAIEGLRRAEDLDQLLREDREADERNLRKK